MPLFKKILAIAALAATVLIYGATILAAYGGHIDPSVHALPSVLTLAFPYLALLTLLCGLGWLFARRFYAAGSSVAVLLLCMGPLATIFPMGRPSSPSPSGRTFTLLTYNCLHMEDLRKPEYPGNRAVEFILASNADIVCLQELNQLSPSEIPNFSDAMLDSLQRAYPHRVVDPHNDLAILSKYPVTLARELPGVGLDGYKFLYELYTVEIDGRSLDIFNVHLPPYRLTEQEREIVTDIHGVRSMKKSVGEFRGPILDKLESSFRERALATASLRNWLDHMPGNVIVCGDFNDVPASWAYRTVIGDDMEDAYCRTNFWPRNTYNDHLFLFHIDQVLYKGALKALDVEVGSIDCSDHYPLLCTFEFT